MGHAALKAESVRAELIGMLPRLKRFAAVLANGSEARDILLRDACARMLDAQHRHERGMLFDRWAFSEIYRLWLERLREQPQAFGNDDDEAVATTRFVASCGVTDPEIAGFLGALPAQQRCALLLVHGEGWSYAEAASVLDAAEQAIVSRVARASAELADRIARKMRETPPPTPIKPLLRPRPAPGASR